MKGRRRLARHLTEFRDPGVPLLVMEARQIAIEHFDARRVLRELLNGMGVD